MDALIATPHQQPTARPGSPNGAPTPQRGFVTADDLWEAIHAYVTAHHDPALPRCFAPVGQEVGRA